MQKGRSTNLEYCLEYRKEIIQDLRVELSSILFDESELLKLMVIVQRLLHLMNIFCFLKPVQFYFFEGILA